VIARTPATAVTGNRFRFRRNSRIPRLIQVDEDRRLWDIDLIDGQELDPHFRIGGAALGARDAPIERKMPSLELA
jgi:hypothetical protein